MPYKAQTQRIYSIVDFLLRSNNRLFYPTKLDIINYLNNINVKIEARTFDRDLYFVRHKLGIEISFDIKEKGYLIAKDEEKAAHKACKVLKILHSGYLGDAFQDLDKSFLKYFSFEYGYHLKGLDFLSLIYQALKSKSYLKIIHAKFHTDKSKTYLVAPQLLKEYQGRYYLIGISQTDEKTRSFGLERVIDIEITDQKFSFDRTEEIIAKFHNIIGLYTEGYVIDKIILKVDNRQVPFFETQPWHESQWINERKKDFSFIQLELVVNYELKQKILMHLDTVEVIEPQWLRDEIYQIIKEAEKKYNSSD